MDKPLSKNFFLLYLSDPEFYLMAGFHCIKYIRFIRLIILLLLICPGMKGQQEQENIPLADYRKVSDFVDDNERCFTCHGESMYHFTDTSSDQLIERMMYHDKVIPREQFYRSNHKSFSCLDCHSDGNLVFPHPNEAHKYEYNTCLDCHGNGKHWARFKFEEIQEEYNLSIHNLKDPKGFSCWKCHNPHTYHISVRNTKNLSATIAYDNNICLSCHSGLNRKQAHDEHDSTNFTREHNWLPNQALHFRNVRCIDCHTQINDSILVAHLVLPKSQAVKHCRECHSKSSILAGTLYKFQSMKGKRDYGFFNAVIMNQSYVMGANRNYFLGTASLVLFGLVFTGIIVHIVFRIGNRNKG